MLVVTAEIFVEYCINVGLEFISWKFTFFNLTESVQEMVDNKLLEERLREAACFGDFETLEELISRGVNINSRNNVNGW